MAGPLGSAPGIIVGVGVGTAAATALEPAIELAKQRAWSDNANRLLDPGLMARLVAQGGVSLEAARTSAEREGYSADKLDALVYLEQRVPAVSEARTLWRRGLMSDELFGHVLVKEGLDQRYVTGILESKTSEPLDPSIIANAIVRGIIDDPGFLPVGPPTAAGKVPAFPRSTIRPLDEAGASGWNRERLFVQTAISGRPMGPEAAAAAVFRGIIERVDYDRAVGEGDVRNEWADAIFEASRYINSVTTAAGLWLRGWKTEAEALAIAAKHGADAETLRNEYLNRGRPATPRQVRLGFARGAKVVGFPWTLDEAIDHAVAQSDIRTEYRDIEREASWSYPSPFVLRGLAQSGAFTQAQTEQILVEMGWKPLYAQLAAKLWHTGTSAAAKEQTRTELADEYIAGFISQAEFRTALEQLGYAGAQLDLEVLHADAAAVKTERARVMTALHKLFVSRTIDATQARNDLESLGMQPEPIDRILPLWTLERDAARATLTAAEIRREYRDNVISLDQAVAQLEQRGYVEADARAFLAG